MFDPDDSDYKAIFKEQEKLIINILSVLGISEGLLLDRLMLMNRLKKIKDRSDSWVAYVKSRDG